MTKKLEDNGLWESSRMMLPEHKLRIITDNYETQHKRSPKPTLDEQEWEQIMRVLMESLGLRISAQFRFYEEYEDCVAVGVVERVDPYLRKFSVDGEWFNMTDIIGAEAL
jgi:hypothetical protein